MSFFKQFGAPSEDANDKRFDVTDDEYRQFVEQQVIAEKSAMADGTATTQSVATKRAKTETSKKKALVPAVAPPLAEFDTVTLGGRKLAEDRGWLRVVYEDSKLMGEILGRLQPLHDNVPLSFTPNGIDINFIDAAHVTFVSIKFPRSSFIAYDNVFASDTTILIPTLAFQTKRDQFSPSHTMTLGFQEAAHDASKLFVTLYPRTGNAKDGLVTRFTVKPSDDDDYEFYQELNFLKFYQYELTISYTLLLQVLTRFKACTVLVLALTDHSFDVAGRSDDQTEQTTQITFVDVDGDEPDTIEKALHANPDCCHLKILKPITPQQPAKIVNYQLSYKFVKRMVMMFAGCRMLRVRVGRGYEEHDGEFLPIYMRADYHNDSTGALVATTSTYLSPWVETDN